MEGASDEHGSSNSVHGVKGLLQAQLLTVSETVALLTPAVPIRATGRDGLLWVWATQMGKVIKR